MLKINKLFASVEGKEILKGIDLEIPAGEVHVIMGPNGSGKSTLSRVLMGDTKYKVKGEILLDDENIVELPAEERSWRGLFLAFQSPVEVPGVYLMEFLRAARNAKLKFLGENPVDGLGFQNELTKKIDELGLEKTWLARSVNEGFSGGEKKRSELLQLAMLEPKIAILDEIDSGLDVDGLREAGETINKLRTKDRSFLLITHYARLLNYVKPDRVHIMKDGKIVQSGGMELAEEIEKDGYGN